MLALALILAVGTTDALPAPTAVPERPDAGAAAPTANSFREVARFGLDRPSCSESGCSATEATVLVGAGGSNFGGFGLGFDLRLTALESEGTFGRGKGEIEAWGHFNGIATQAPNAARPPAGELGAVGELGWGYVSPASLRGGGGLVLLLDALSVNAGAFDGATLVAFTPNVEVGWLARSAALSTSFEASLHIGGNGFYGDGPLTHFDSSGTAEHWAVDPYFAAELRLDIPLSPTANLRLCGTLALTPDWQLPGTERTILWGRFQALVRFGPLLTGPMLTFFAPNKQPGSAGTVTGAVPESDFLWMLGF